MWVSNSTGCKKLNATQNSATQKHKAPVHARCLLMQTGVCVTCRPCEIWPPRPGDVAAQTQMDMAGQQPAELRRVTATLFPMLQLVFFSRL